MKLLDTYGPFILLAIIRAIDEAEPGTFPDKEYIREHANETLLRWGKFERSKEQIELALGALCEIGCFEYHDGMPIVADKFFYTLDYKAKETVDWLVREIREVL